MDNTTPLSRVTHVIAERCDDMAAAQIYTDHQLQRDLGLDSLDRITLLIDLEDEFDIVFDDPDWLRLAEPTTTVRALIQQVERELSHEPRSTAS